MKSVLVVHPIMSYYAGGEILCIYACKAMQELGYHVYLACDEYDPEEVLRRWGETAYQVMLNCEWVEKRNLTPRIPILRAYQQFLHDILFNGPIRKVREEADFVLSTQQVYLDPKLYNYCIVYDMRSSVFTFGLFEHPGARWYHRPLIFLDKYVRRMEESAYERTTFIAESRHIAGQLERSGLNCAGFIQAPSQPMFKVGLKRPYVVQVTRLNPFKRPELFAEIARRLPEYEFVYVYMVTDMERKYILPHNYEKDFLANAPSNLKAVNRFIIDCPEYMEEAKVYLYTGKEPGATTSLGQAALAGCIPVSFSPGGGADQVEDLGVGYTYETVDEAVEKIRLAMSFSIDPNWISEKAKIFLPETFMENLKKIVSEARDSG